MEFISERMLSNGSKFPFRVQANIFMDIRAIGLKPLICLILQRL